VAGAAGPGGGWGVAWGSGRGDGNAQDTPGQDESYLVSVSDLMVGLLFLFIIILMAFALNFRSAEDAADATLEELVVERDRLAVERDALETAQAALAVDRDRLLADRDRLAGITELLLARDAERAELLTRIKAAAAARGLEVEVDLENGILRLPEALLFASNEAQLSESGQAAIVVLGEVLERTLPCYAAGGEPGECPGGSRDVLEVVLIEGHTDDRPIRSGPFADNWALSAARARSTYQALVAAAPALDTLANAAGTTLLALGGYAERRPVIAEATEAARRVNRRIDLRFIARGPDAEVLAELLASLEVAIGAP
jgi:flagellar motor protein MotB